MGVGVGGGVIVRETEADCDAENEALNSRVLDSVGVPNVADCDDSIEVLVDRERVVVLDGYPPRPFAVVAQKQM